MCLQNMNAQKRACAVDSRHSRTSRRIFRTCSARTPSASRLFESCLHEFSSSVSLYRIARPVFCLRPVSGRVKPVASCQRSSRHGLRTADHMVVLTIGPALDPASESSGPRASGTSGDRRRATIFTEVTLMRALTTIATVHDDGTLTAPAPTGLARGRHRVVVVVEEASVPAAQIGSERTEVSSGKPSPWQKMADFRARLGATAPTVNTVIEMRKEERS